MNELQRIPPATLESALQDGMEIRIIWDSIHVRSEGSFPSGWNFVGVGDSAIESIANLLYHWRRWQGTDKP